MQESTKMSNNDNIANTDRDSSNRAYNAARAEWHSHRASISADGSSKMLHERFASLYRARTEEVRADTATSADF
jgi:hypothetical protein